MRMIARSMILSVALGLCVGTAGEPDFKPIFNGKDLSGWTGDPTLWSVEDGAITGRTTAEKPIKNNTFLIWTNGSPGNFELRLKFKILPQSPQGGANSGIQYRSKVFDAGNWIVGGYQADMEAGKNYTGILYEEKMSRGIMALRGEKVLWDKEGKKKVTGSLGKAEDIEAALNKQGWNDYVIIANGNVLQHFLNGKQSVEVVDESDGKAAASGVIAFQVHVGPPMLVQFKDVRLKELK
jgi:hypothetical protein